MLTELVTKLSGSRLSGIGNAALVAGVFALMPVMFETSIAAGAAAVFTAFGAGAAGTVMNTWKTQNKAIEVIDHDRKACQELQEKVASFETCIKDFAAFCVEHIDLVLSSKLAKDEFGFLLDILKEWVHVRVHEGYMKELVHVRVLTTEHPTLLTLLQEEVNIHSMRVNTLMQQLQRSTASNHEVSKIIEHILVELRECPNDKGIQTTIVNFIREIFNTRLSAPSTLSTPLFSFV